MKRIIPLCALVFATKAFALFGVGDIVFDPTAFAELVETYNQDYQQLQTVSNILNINTSQLTSLKGMQASIGVSLGNGNSGALSLASLGSVTQGLGLTLPAGTSVAPGGGPSPTTIYQQSGPQAGTLDVFMGANLNSFLGSLNPIQNFTNWATSQTMGSIGASIGLSDPAISLSITVGNMSGAQRAISQTEIASAVANLQAQNYVNGSLNRRVAIQTEANIASQAQQSSDQATTLNEQAAANSAIAASNARLQALQAQQQNTANETLVSAESSQNTLLTDMQARRAREEAQKQLDARIDR